jgi:poly-gamma-glutamate capsule biosynthesis protein CapA/YwtB (metallophosphatase superfamily)
MQAARRNEQKEGWLYCLLQRRNPNIAAVALANKNARIVWALLAHHREFQSDYMAAEAAG